MDIHKDISGFTDTYMDIPVFHKCPDIIHNMDNLNIHGSRDFQRNP